MNDHIVLNKIKPAQFVLTRPTANSIYIEQLSVYIFESAQLQVAALVELEEIKNSAPFIVFEEDQVIIRSIYTGCIGRIG